MYERREDYTDLTERPSTVYRVFYLLGTIHVVMGILLIVFSAVGTSECGKYHCKEWGQDIFVHCGLAILYIITGVFSILNCKKRLVSLLILLLILSVTCFIFSLSALCTSFFYAMPSLFRESWMVLFLLTGIVIVLEIVLFSISIVLSVKLLCCPSVLEKEERKACNNP